MVNGGQLPVWQCLPSFLSLSADFVVVLRLCGSSPRGAQSVVYRLKTPTRRTRKALSGMLWQEGLWTGFLSSPQAGSPAPLEHLAWIFVSPCCPALGHAGVSATTGFPCRCRSAQRPKERRTRQRASTPC
eukprot:scaffold7345_cov129-Isochrysis_galbana.AAC.2